MSGRPGSLAIEWATSMRKPSTPRSSQNRMIRSNSAGTAGSVQFRSGCSGANRCRYHSPSGQPRPGRAAEGRRPVVRRQLAVRPRPGRITNRERSGASGPPASTAWNHACSLEKWLGTRSTVTLMPRACAVGEQRVEVGQRAEHRVDVARVGDVVAAVGHGGAVERREPDRVDAELDEVVEALPHADQVAGAVAVAVGEAAGVDLVEDRGAPTRAAAMRR